MTTTRRRLLTLAGLALLLTGGAHAATWNVPAGGSIQSALDAAAPGDTIVLSAGTYYESLNWVHNGVDQLKDGIILQGAGEGQTVIDGGGTGRCLYTKGLSNAARIEGCTFQNGRDLWGGAIYNDASSPSVSHCTFRNNTAVWWGGAVENSAGNPTFSDCTFSANYAYGSGAMDNDNHSTVTVARCTFENNNAAQLGGAMGNYNGSGTTVTGCTFFFNDAVQGGGAIYNDSSDPSLSDCAFMANTSAVGAAMLNWGGEQTLLRCAFNNNAAGDVGGGIYNEANHLTLSRCTFMGNEASGEGGGGMFSASTSSVNVADCTFDSNRADEGGAMVNDNNAAIVTNCAFLANRAVQNGGAMVNVGSPTIAGCLFWNNRVTEGIGGALSNAGGNPTITNCTFVGNQAAVAGGAMDNASGRVVCTPVVTNCIVWGNASAISGSATVTYSDIQGGWPGTGNFDADPLFVDPDGPQYHRTLDLRLRSGSPCINRGSNPAIEAAGVTTDLEGNARIVDATVDMGAYEYAPNPALLIEALRAQVTALVTSGVALPADGQSLYAKLDAAQAALAAGDVAGVKARLQDFANQVSAFVRTGRLTSRQGQPLLDATNALLSQL